MVAGNEFSTVISPRAYITFSCIGHTSVWWKTGQAALYLTYFEQCLGKGKQPLYVSIIHLVWMTAELCAVLPVWFARSYLLPAPLTLPFSVKHKRFCSWVRVFLMVSCDQPQLLLNYMNWHLIIQTSLFKKQHYMRPSSCFSEKNNSVLPGVLSRSFPRLIFCEPVDTSAFADSFSALIAKNCGFWDSESQHSM